VKTSKDLGAYFDGFFEAIRDEEPIAEYKTAVRLIFEFGQYMDMMAASNPHRFHHVYEWGMVGAPEGRLFELTATPTGGSTIITYQFQNSVVPNENGVIFAQKATVMESGQSVTIDPSGPVPINNGEMFRVGPFTFIPGGEDTNGAFRETFMLYFTTRPNITNNKGVSMHPSALTKSGGKRDGKKIYDSINSQ
jgi:hypothetical protein